MKKILGSLTIVFLLFPIPLALMVGPVDAFSFWWWIVCGSEMLAMTLLGLLIPCLGNASNSSSTWNMDSHDLRQIKKYQELDFIRYKAEKK